MRRALFLLAVPASGVVVAFGCSLGLDASRIGAVDASAADAASSPETSSDALGDRGVVTLPDGGACAKDDDCKTTSACVSSSRCDPVSHVCVLDVCNVGACKSAICDTSANSCTVPVPYGFHPTSFKVSQGGVGCGGPTRCFAVVHPYAFVGTPNGIAGFQISDPANGTPPAVTVTGVSFVPARVISVDRRVFFIGSPLGGGTSTRIPIAWVDVPGTPFLTTLAASAALVTSPPTDLGLVVPTDKTSLFFVYTNASKAFPTSIVGAPLSDTTTLSQFASPALDPNASIVASSGSRLVAYRWEGANTNYQALFTFANNAGTGTASAGSEQLASAMGEVYSQPTFAMGPDGSVLWMAPSVVTPDGGPAATLTARMAWLVATGTTPTFDTSVHVDVETYVPPLGFGSAVAGPMAWIDQKTALVLAAARENRSQTSVQVASRAATPATIVSGKRSVLSVGIGQVAAVGSNGFGYVLAQDDPQNLSATVHIFAPGCN